jgi:putative transposase
MGIGRSTFYDTPDARARDLSIVAEMKTICDEFEAYGYRRVDAELRHRGIVVLSRPRIAITIIRSCPISRRT